MNEQKIKKLIANRNNLTYKEKKQLSEYILNNSHEREVAIRGAIYMNNLDLATELILFKNNVKLKPNNHEPRTNL